MRLDSRSALDAGGASGKNLTQLPADQNELLRRLTTSDESELMPLGGPKLSDADIKRICGWLEEGADWPELRADGTDVPQPGMFESISIQLREWTRFNKISLVGVLVLGLVVLVVERFKKRGSKRAEKFTAPHFVAALLGLMLVAVLQHHVGTVGELTRERNVLRSDVVSLGVPEAVPGGDEFGPVPRRPLHPPRLGGVYYRGNDERDARLFNGGFYRTATFTVELVDCEGKILKPGSSGAGSLALRVSIRRAKGTTNAHFSDRAITSIYLSRQSSLTEIQDQPVPVEVIEPDWFWRVTYPLGDPINGELRGRLFLVASGTVRDGVLIGRPHYGIDYTVRFTDGTISDDSEIWMGSLFQTSRVRQTKPGTIHATEWFDFRPLPEIEGEKSKDPKLLGIETPDG